MSVYRYKRMDGRTAEELQQVHSRPSLALPALYPGFVMAEGLAPATLAALMGNVPIHGAAPVALANLNTVYQVADLEEARRAAMYIQGAKAGIHGFGVGTALGDVFIY